MIARTRDPRWAASTAPVAPIFVLCAPFLLSGRCLLALDVVAYYIPHGLVTRAALLRDHELPRWNPYQYAGTPLLGNSQGNHCYPPNWLFVIAPEDGFELFVFLHLLAAAWGMYRLGRGFGLGRPASVLSALAYALGYGAVARIHAGHPSILACHALAPILLFTLFRSAAVGESPGGSVPRELPVRPIGPPARRDRLRAGAGGARDAADPRRHAAERAHATSCTRRR